MCSICTGPGDSPINITLSATSSSSVLVAWLSPAIPNGIITSYTVYITLVDCPMENTTSYSQTVTDRMEYEITGLSPYQQVRVQVSSSTAIGEGPKSAMEVGRSEESSMFSYNTLHVGRA